MPLIAVGNHSGIMFLYPMAPGMPKSIVMNQIVLIWPRGVEEICDAVFLVELCTTEGSELVPFCA